MTQLERKIQILPPELGFGMDPTIKIPELKVFDCSVARKITVVSQVRQPPWNLIVHSKSADNRPKQCVIQHLSAIG